MHRLPLGSVRSREHMRERLVRVGRSLNGAAHSSSSDDEYPQYTSNIFSQIEWFERLEKLHSLGRKEAEDFFCRSCRRRKVSNCNRLGAFLGNQKSKTCMQPEALLSKARLETKATLQDDDHGQRHRQPVAHSPSGSVTTSCPKLEPNLLRARERYAASVLYSLQRNG